MDDAAFLSRVVMLCGAGRWRQIAASICRLPRRAGNHVAGKSFMRLERNIGKMEKMNLCGGKPWRCAATVGTDLPD